MGGWVAGICGCRANTMEHMWRSGDNLREVVFSFYQLSPGDQTGVIGLGGKCPQSLYLLVIFCGRHGVAYYMHHSIPLLQPPCEAEASSPGRGEDTGSKRQQLTQVLTARK